METARDNDLLQPGRYVTVQTHAWGENGNIELRGMILGSSGGITLRQFKTSYGSGVIDQERIVFVPWGAIVYVSEPEWRPFDASPQRIPVTTRRLPNYNLNTN